MIEETCQHNRIHGIVNSKKYCQDGHMGIWKPTRYLEQHAQREKWLRKQSWQNKTVLDVGAGSGRFTRIVAEAQGQVVAADIYREALEQLKEFNPVQCDAERLPFTRFDVALCMGLIMHVPNVPQALSELRKVADMVYMNFCVGPYPRRHVHNPPHFWTYPEPLFYKWIEKAGFNYVVITPLCFLNNKFLVLS